MSRVTTPAIIENLGDLYAVTKGLYKPEQVRRVTVEEALVDTGAMILSLPTQLIQQLGLNAVGVKTTRTAAGPRQAKVFEAVRLTVQDRDCSVDVLEVPDDVPVLIGQIPLEVLDFVVHPQEQKLVGNPRHGGKQMFEMYLASLLTFLAVIVAPAHCQEAKQTPAKDQPAWKTLFDGKSLAGWKSAGYLGTGKIEIKDGAIVMGVGERMTGVTYQGKDFPKMDYEVAFEGKRLAGDDFFCTATFPVGDSFCSLVVGGWGGQVIGLSSLNFMDASENESTTAKEFKKDQWYRVRVRVSKDRLQAWIDKDRVVDVDTTDKKISIRFECDNCKPFGFCTWSTVGAVRDIRVRMLTEAEKKEMPKN